MSLLRPIPPDSFDIKKRIIKNMKSAKADDQIFETIQKLYEKSLIAENILLSRPEKDHLLHDVLKTVLTDMLKKLDTDK